MKADKTPHVHKRHASETKWEIYSHCPPPGYNFSHDLFIAYNSGEEHELGRVKYQSFKKQLKAIKSKKKKKIMLCFPE